MSPVILVEHLIVIFAAAPANLFPLIYSRRPWWRSFIGRALMLDSIGMAMLIDITILFYIFGRDYFGHDVVVPLVYVLVTAGLWAQFVALVRDVASTARKEKEAETCGK